MAFSFGPAILNTIAPHACLTFWYGERETLPKRDEIPESSNFEMKFRGTQRASFVSRL